MNTTIALIALLILSAAILLLLCIVKFGMKLDAGLVFGFCFFFELIGFFYPENVPGSPLLLLIFLPIIPVLMGIVRSPAESSGLLQNKGMWLWGLFFFYSVMSIGWAYHADLGLTKIQVMAAHGVIPGIYTFLVYKKYKTFSWVYVLLFGIAYSIVHLLYAGYSAEYPGRLTLPGSNPIYDARILFAVVTIAIWGARIPFLFRIIAIVLGMTAALATQSRGPLVAFVAANLLIWGFTTYRKYKQGEFTVKGGVVAGGFIFILSAAFSLWYYWEVLMEAIGASRFAVLVNQSVMSGDANYTGRKFLQGLAWDKFVEHPFFGTGLGGSSVNGLYNYPHNIILEVLSQLGIVGFSLWLTAFLFTVYAARRSGILLVLLLQMLGYAMFSGDYGFNFEYILVSFLVFAYMPMSTGREVNKLAQNNLSYYRSGLRRGGDAGETTSIRVTSAGLGRTAHIHGSAQSLRRGNKSGWN